MDLLLAMGYGALGGAVVEAVVSSDRVLAWNAARHLALEHAAPRPPALTAYLDPLSDIAAGVTRILLGAVAGWLFHTQVTGGYAAIAVGCSAPTVLRQLGSTRLSSVFGLETGPAPTEEHTAEEHHLPEAHEQAQQELAPQHHDSDPQVSEIPVLEPQMLEQQAPSPKRHDPESQASEIEAPQPRLEIPEQA